MSEGTRDICAACGKPIKYKAGARRRKYCDDRCRQKGHRQRVRFSEDPTLVAEAIAERKVRWVAHNYPEEMIEQLMIIWSDYGGAALMRVESVLALHQSWAIQLAAEMWAKRDKPL
jgi:hypothetical protein